MDSVRCGKCGYVYWTRWNENWGTCPNCCHNNDYPGSIEKPILVNSKFIFKFVSLKEIEEDRRLNQEKRDKQFADNLPKILQEATT